MTTLKISDLSVGDWVEIDHEDYGWQPAQINVCGDVGIGAYFKDIDPEEEYDCTLSQARPIPITPEILVANGFAYKLEADIYYHADSMLELCEVLHSWRRVINGGEYIIDKIEFVHQLQRALRLAGVDKEIVMPNK